MLESYSPFSLCLGGGGVAAASSPVSAQPDPGIAAQVAERDTLIAAQENLLNAYRCMFQVDLGAVKGGGCPADETTPGAAPSDPAAADVEARDNLIAAQEDLLNAYRCNHQIDTELVPGGCDGQTVDPGPQPEPEPDPVSPTATVHAPVAAGNTHSCAIRADQTIACWGDNSNGRANPLPGRFTAVAAGNTHSCAIRADQTIACWGDNEAGQSDAPPGRFAAVAAGSGYSCAITTGGQIKCWGFNWRTDVENHSYFGPTAPADPEPVVADTPSGRFTDIAAAEDYSCAITTGGEVKCWGDNEYAWMETPSGQFTDIATGGSHVCGIRADQTVACWGSDMHRQTDAPSGQFTAITAGFNYSCAIRADQTVACWGNTRDNFWNRVLPRSDQFTAIASGSGHWCGIKDDRTVDCWGNTRNDRTVPPSGLFGPPYEHTTAPEPGTGAPPTPAGGNPAIAAGSRHACAIRADRTIACWGDNSNGQTDAPPGQFTAIGGSGLCAIRADRTIACWGRNENPWGHYIGQADAPAGQFTAISPDSWCAIRADRTIACWGEKDIDKWVPAGQFIAVATPSCAIGLNNRPTCSVRSSRWFANTSGEFTAIVVGGDHRCGLGTNGGVICGGSNNHGQLNVSAGEATAISAGTLHTCAIRTDQTLACWGKVGYPLKRSNAPSGQYTAVAAGYGYTCAIRTDRTINCWGDNSHGQTDAPSGLFGPPYA